MFPEDAEEKIEASLGYTPVAFQNIVVYRACPHIPPSVVPACAHESVKIAVVARPERQQLSHRDHHQDHAEAHRRREENSRSWGAEAVVIPPSIVVTVSTSSD